MAAKWLEELNPAQREAVTHGDGPLLIVAGAGTGKTKTLACRVAWLVSQGVPAERICLLTFTRRAAAEMIGRAGHLTDPAAAGKVWGGTFHAVGNRLLRLYGRAIDLPSNFTVMDQSDTADLLNLIRNESGLAKGDQRFPRKETLAAIYSRSVNAETKLAQTLRTHFPWCQDHKDGIREIFQRYAQRKREQNVLDYDDLLLFWALLAETPGIGESVEERFDHILVDEYQDTNAVQSRILRAMRKTKRNICAVGDDAQSIYSFRAATVRNILDFPEQFPGTRVVKLEQNYRSTQPILAASNAVMDQARERYEKNLWSARESDQKPVLSTCVDEPDQCKTVCRHIIAHLEEGTPLRRQAVLFRAGWHSDTLEVELARRKIPFHKYGGLKFVEAAHVKDMIALLRMLENPYDEVSWFRVLLLLEGIGPAAARKVIESLGVRRMPPRGKQRADAEEGRLGPLSRLHERPPTVPAGAREQFEALRVLLAECSGMVPLKPGSRRRKRGATRVQTQMIQVEEASGNEAEVQEPVADDAATNDGLRGAVPPPAVQIERIRRFYEPICKAKYENPKIRLRDLEQLEQIAAGYRSRGRFLSDLTLDPPTSTSDLAGVPYLEEDYLILSTVHSAKGCEWDVVHIIHASDGMMPSDMALEDDEGLEEERRLFYVAMTRARDMLYVYFPFRYYRRRSAFGDQHHYAQLTRFLDGPVRKLFEQRGVVGLETDDRPHGGRAARKVDDWLKGLWQD
jgi:DNA helicase-2/ATP-dependent DNA helicase PcrA